MDGRTRGEVVVDRVVGGCSYCREKERKGRWERWKRERWKLGLRLGKTVGFSLKKQRTGAGGGRRLLPCFTETKPKATASP